MKDTMTVKEAAFLWGISERRVAFLCKQGRIPGAVKKERFWLIPTGAEKPEDKRYKEGYFRLLDDNRRLPLPIGVSDYRIASTEYYYVDKTLLIRDFLDERAQVSLFTRPRRFGKTLNMDMLRTFFEKTKEDTSVYFQSKNIWRCGQRYRDYQGKYPVIFLTFKDAKKKNWEETYRHISQLVISEFRRHAELACSDRIAEKEFYNKVADGQADKNEMESSLLLLTHMLHDHYGVPAILIIDEYDTPIEQGHVNGFYNEVILFMRNLFSGGLKDNRHLAYGFMTGILRVAKESIFSGLNNVKINSILDNRYSEYFGFTPNEVKEMAAYYRAEEKYDEICSWYDGYRFGRSDIFNPWSVISYFGGECCPRAYWQSTGSNDIIHEILQLSNAEIVEGLKRLLSGETVSTSIDTGVIYPQIYGKPSGIYSFLLMAGYLKPVSENMLIGDSDFYALAIPNREIRGVYRKEVLEKLEDILPQSVAFAVQLALYEGDGNALRESLRNLLLQSASYYDTVGENFYQGFLLGLCAVMEGYVVTSNREAGDGRYDICLKPKKENFPGVLIELKAGKNCSDEELKELAGAALDQINDRKYDAELMAEDIRRILKYGVAFSGKSVEVAVETD